MKKFVYMLVFIMILIVTGCSNSDEETSENVNTENNEEKTDVAANNNQEDLSTEQESQGNGDTLEVEDASQDAFEVPDLQLQVSKLDEESGVTIESSEVYSYLEEVIMADPKGGIPNDFSIYPDELVLNDDGTTSLLFIVINRLHAPIRNISFELTLGNQDGDSIFEGLEVSLEEESFGIIETDSAVPFLIDISPEDEEIYMEITEENIDLRMENYDVDLIE
ncbi:hypothetical protein ACM26V_12130 [Salipaludibacillus sp. HK11]|uniref:hypothetical protein n=1 Tax=Salipaludibacillus sp. HK11 TaxID=3394320 RepID=UPI0039FBD339